MLKPNIDQPPVINKQQSLFSPSPSRPSSTANNSSNRVSSLGSGNTRCLSSLPTLDSDLTRLIVVSNRLPVTIKSHDRSAGSNHHHHHQHQHQHQQRPSQPPSSSSPSNHQNLHPNRNSYSFKLSSGGLVSALSGCQKQMTFSWIGWSGLDVPECDREEVQRELNEKFNCKAIWLDDELADRHYNGFSNSILWPLFHYHPGEMNFDETSWVAYKDANRAFADSVHHEIEDSLSKGEDVLVWVQDYHLMLLPMMLRELIDKAHLAGNLRPGVTTRGKVSIGFFLHTPFPSSETYRILPVRREILLGLLHCDLVGFHTYDYARHFLSSCTRILGLPTMPNGLSFKKRYVHVGSFPIGIEPDQFKRALEKPEVIERVNELENRFKGIKVIVGVDRLDYIKGIPQKLHALDVFLSEHPEWIGKVVLVQVAVPSRQDVEEYQNLRNSVNELVGRINGRFGTIEHMPIHFLHRSIGFDELCALYAVSDACLITSTRDGMNLVSHEYVACQEKKNGVMILSEFTGAAHSLNGSLIVNPWATDQVSDAILSSVTMSDQQRRINFKKLYSYVSKFTSVHWGLTFVADLQRILKRLDDDLSSSEGESEDVLEEGALTFSTDEKKLNVNLNEASIGSGLDSIKEM